jgi:16S rRNA (guanine1207-N2)-methyltransferase
VQRKHKAGEHYYTQQPESTARLGLLRTRLRGRPFEFLTSAGVFSRTRVDPGTRLLIESMVLPQQGSVLDLGCGYGPVGIAAATINPDVQVVMVDINERALRLARKNVQRNNVTNVEVRSGWLYQPVGDTKFEAVLSNPPLSAGKPTVSSIVGEAPSHLQDNGSLQVVVRSKTGGSSILREMEATFGNVKVVARRSGYRVLLAKKS